MAGKCESCHPCYGSSPFLNWGQSHVHGGGPFLSDKCLTPLIALLVKALVVVVKCQEISLFFFGSNDSLFSLLIFTLCIKTNKLLCNMQITRVILLLIILQSCKTDDADLPILSTTPTCNEIIIASFGLQHLHS